MDGQPEGELFGSRAWSAEAMANYLGEAAQMRVALTPTRNHVSMISVAFVSSGAATVRLHEAFLSAPSAVHAALADYLRRPTRAAWRIVTAFARMIAPASRPAKALPRARSAGRVWDLKAILDDVNRAFFGNGVACRIGWGRGRPVRRGRRRSRSIRYGSWDAVTRTIRIHPLLDDTRVPRDFVRYIVFHEALHAVVAPVRQGGRRLDHPPQFKALERSFPELPRMRRLSRDLLRTLVG